MAFYSAFYLCLLDNLFFFSFLINLLIISHDCQHSLKLLKHLLSSWHITSLNPTSWSHHRLAAMSTRIAGSLNQQSRLLLQLVVDIGVVPSNKINSIVCIIANCIHKALSLRQSSLFLLFVLDNRLRSGAASETIVCPCMPLATSDTTLTNPSSEGLRLCIL